MTTLKIIPREKPIPALLDFVVSWIPELSTSHQVAAASIPAFIPPPLRSIYALTGNWPIPFSEQWRHPNWVPGLFGTQDRLLPIDQLIVKENRLTFIYENQSVWSCETLIYEDDPPVFSDAFTIDGRDEGMREVCPLLSHFLTTFCLHELAFGSKNLFHVDSGCLHPNELVTKELSNLWIDAKYCYIGNNYSFYYCYPGILIMNTGSYVEPSYWIGYNKEECSLLLDSQHRITRIH